jgi:hypothetical protein
MIELTLKMAEEERRFVYENEPWWPTDELKRYSALQRLILRASEDPLVVDENSPIFQHAVALMAELYGDS